MPPQKEKKIGAINVPKQGRHLENRVLSEELARYVVSSVLIGRQVSALYIACNSGPNSPDDLKALTFEGYFFDRQVGNSWAAYIDRSSREVGGYPLAYDYNEDTLEGPPSQWKLGINPKVTYPHYGGKFWSFFAAQIAGVPVKIWLDQVDRVLAQVGSTINWFRGNLPPGRNIEDLRIPTQTIDSVSNRIAYTKIRFEYVRYVNEHDGESPTVHIDTSTYSVSDIDNLLEALWQICLYEFEAYKQSMILYDTDPENFTYYNDSALWWLHSPFLSKSGLQGRSGVSAWLVAQHNSYKNQVGSVEAKAISNPAFALLMLLDNAEAPYGCSAWLLYWKLAWNLGNSPYSHTANIVNGQYDVFMRKYHFRIPFEPPPKNLFDFPYLDEYRVWFPRIPWDINVVRYMQTPRKKRHEKWLHEKSMFIIAEPFLVDPEQPMPDNPIDSPFELPDHRRRVIQSVALDVPFVKLTTVIWPNFFSSVVSRATSDPQGIPRELSGTYANLFMFKGWQVRDRNRAILDRENDGLGIFPTSPYYLLLGEKLADKIHSNLIHEHQRLLARPLHQRDWAGFRERIERETSITLCHSYAGAGNVFLTLSQTLDISMRRKFVICFSQGFDRDVDDAVRADVIATSLFDTAVEIDGERKSFFGERSVRPETKDSMAWYVVPIAQCEPLSLQQQSIWLNEYINGGQLPALPEGLDQWVREVLEGNVGEAYR